jgi:hypothetical protein
VFGFFVAGVSSNSVNVACIVICGKRILFIFSHLLSKTVNRLFKRNVDKPIRAIREEEEA